MQQVLELGSHHMFVAEVVGVDVDSRYLDEKGKFQLNQAGPMVYSHGEYLGPGKKIGSFGYSVKKKKKKHLKHYYLLIAKLKYLKNLKKMISQKQNHKKVMKLMNWKILNFLKIPMKSSLNQMNLL